MKIINFQGANSYLPQMNNAPVKVIPDGDTFIMCLQPSKEDIERLNNGGVLVYQAFKGVNPYCLYVLDENGNPILEKEQKMQIRDEEAKKKIIK